MSDKIWTPTVPFLSTDITQDLSLYFRPSVEYSWGEKKKTQQKMKKQINSQSSKKIMKETDTFIHIRGQNDQKTFTLENQVNNFMKWSYSVSNIWVLKSDGKEWR